MQSVHKLNTYSLDLYNINFQTTTVLFTRNASSQTLTELLLLLLALSYFFICARLQSVKGSWSQTFGVSPSWEFLFVYLSIKHACLLLVCMFDVFVSVYLFRMYCVHIASCCVRFRCVFVTYRFHNHDLCYCRFCLLLSCEMILNRFHLCNNIYGGVKVFLVHEFDFIWLTTQIQIRNTPIMSFKVAQIIENKWNLIICHMQKQYV